MKKVVTLLLFTIFIFCIPISTKAAYDAVISGDTVRIRSAAGTNNSALYTVNSGTSISVADKTLYSGNGCSAKWYKVTYKSTTGYVCSTYVKFVDNSYAGINTNDWSARVNGNNVATRKSASTSSSIVDTLSLGVNVSILSTTTSNNSGCSTNKWHKIQYYGNKTAYICSKYVTSKKDITKNDDEYAKTLKAAGFTDSYIPYLTYLHNKYPNWTFVAKKTNVNFSSAVNSEEGKNYMQTTNNNYRTSTKPAEGSSWFKVNQGVIAFYMDSRNWLTEERIFMFEKLDYANEFESIYPKLVKAIFGSGKLSDDKYTTPMINAGKTNKISPVHIASRIRLEVGANGSDSTNGAEFTYKGKKYSGYYNFFNIGAYEETIDGVKYGAITRGLAYAAKLINRSGEAWDNIQTAITEGSAFLANGYINKGQGTLYYQKFNVSPDAYFSRYTHQYMTNIQAPATEGNQTYNSYKSASILNQPFIFEIPVYNNMPSYTSLPNSGDNNNYLKSLEVEGFTLSPKFDKDVLTYEVYVPSTTTKANIKASQESSKATMNGTGSIDLKTDNTDVTITVKSEAGSERKYIITIKKEEIKEETDENTNNVQPMSNNMTATSVLNKSSLNVNKLKNGTDANTIQNNLIKSGALSATIKNNNNSQISGNSLIATGYTLTIKTSANTESYTLSITGDTSGDGKITILDLLQIQKHLKGDKKLNGAYLLAADTSGDGKVTILDLLQVQKHLKGDKKL